MAKKGNYSRKHRAELDARELRLLALAKYRREKRKLAEYVKDLGISRRTAQNDVQEFLRRQRAMSEDFVNADRTIQQEEIDDLKLELIGLKAMSRSETLSLKDRLAAALACVDRQVKVMERESSLHGWDKPSKQQLEITGPQLDPLTMEVRALLFDLPEAERQKVRDYARSLVPPVVIDADCFSECAVPQTKQLTEGEDAHD